MFEKPVVGLDMRISYSVKPERNKISIITRLNNKSRVLIVRLISSACTLMILASIGCSNSKNQSERETFVPTEFEVPLELEQASFRLRPIRQSDARLDYEAVMASATQLRLQFGGDWPAEDFSIEENREQLAIHEKQFLDRSAFVYTVLRPDEKEILGCVYIYPGEKNDVDATVTYWVRESESADALRFELFKALDAWLQTDWPFQTVEFDGIR